jgi:diguanylate cyclase (GGDEF)-like protein/PAS domain S-box-containing protein
MQLNLIGVPILNPGVVILFIYRELMDIKDINIALLEKCNFLLMVFDNDDQLSYLSPRWSELNVAAKKVPTIKSFYACCTTESKTLLQQQINALQLQHNELDQFDIKLKLATDYFIKLNCCLHSVQQNQRQYMVLIFNQHFAQVSSVISNNELQTIIENAGEVLKVGYWQLDCNTSQLFWTDEIYTIHGVSPSNYSPELDTAINFYHEDDKPKIAHAVEQALASGQGWSCIKLRVVGNDQQERIVISSGNVSRNKNGVITKLYGIFQDISGSEKIALERDFLVTALKETTVGMVIADKDKRVIWVNGSFERITGYTLNQVEGKKLGAILQGEKTDANTIEQLKIHLKKGIPITTRILNYTQSGDPYWNELAISPIFRDGKVAYYFAVQNDVTKEINIEHKLIALNTSLEQRIQARTQELSSLNQKLEKQANIDPLTGCLNRRTLYRTLSDELLKTQNKNTYISLLMLDIDHFKAINDNYGHEAGDLSLKELTNTLRALTRKQDFVFRLGGEEFLIIMPNTNKAEAKQAAERIKNTINQHQVFYRNKNISFTVSIGLLTHDGSISLQNSLKYVDDYLYEAKTKGRNRIVD